MHSRVLMTSLALVAANVVPLAGVLFFDWTVYELLLLFWAENLIIGTYTVARMVTLYTRNGDGRVLFTIPFFCVHFGFFTLIHGAFVMGYFRPEGGPETPVLLAIWVPFLALVISHGVSFVGNFLRGQEYRGMKSEDAMMAPYRRVIIMHLTVVGGGWLISLFGEPLLALVLLVVLKTFTDLVTHVHEHREKVETEARVRQTGRADSHIFKQWDE